MSCKPFVSFAIVVFWAGAASVAFSQTGGNLDQPPGIGPTHEEPAAAQPSAGGPFTIPEPLKAEHHEIYTELEAATTSNGQTGKAARTAFDVLRPHFEKEERYALPQLGALAALADMPGRQGARLTAQQRKDLVARTERLRAELPQMLEEHKAISAALKELEGAANDEGQQSVAQLARRILEHAKTEEEVLYPAALLAGRYATAARSRRR